MATISENFTSLLNSLSVFVGGNWKTQPNLCQVMKNSRLDHKGLFRVSLSPQINNSYSPSLQDEAQNSALSHFLVCSGEIWAPSNRITHPRRLLCHKPFDWYHVCFSSFLLSIKKNQNAQPFTQQPLSGWHFTSLLFVFHVAYPQRAIELPPFTLTLSLIKNMAGQQRGGPHCE